MGTTKLFYDSSGHLLSVDTPAEGRLYIATDQLGSPLAVFAAQGELVKEVSYSPFGELIADTNPSLEIPLGFAGGLVCDHTRLLLFAGEDVMGTRVYDPTIGQWMTPKIPNLMKNALTDPQDIFAYRFRNNDPVNFQENQFPTGKQY